MIDPAALFDALCHRHPARTPAFDGGLTWVCARCIGLYAGVLAGLVACWRGRRGRWPAWMSLLAPMIILAPFGLPDDPAGRLLTGYLFGLGVAALASPARPRDTHSARDQTIGIALTVLGFLVPAWALTIEHGRGILNAVTALGAGGFLVLASRLLVEWMRASARPARRAPAVGPEILDAIRRDLDSLRLRR